MPFSKHRLKLFNTLTREKEELKTLEPGLVRMYTCGPTVYHFAHIGNFRTYIFEDLLRRTLKLFGYRVIQVMNITDIDDKTIKGAIQKGVTLKEFTTPYRDAFFQDLGKLHIERAEHYPEATAYIPQMIEMIQKLIDRNVAYKSQDGSIYFAIQKFPHYGCLSHLKLDELQVGASHRVAADEYDKDHASDFVLWKSYDKERDGSIFWESPFGPGRPGWHLECSAMAMGLLGETLDIHCGGVDNMFPHHENEIAQSEACSGKPFVKMWLHAEHLVVDGKKMSKSLGNFYTLRDLLDKGLTGPEVRYMLLQTHYKTQLNFTFEGMAGARVALHRLNSLVHRLTIQKGVSHNLVAPLIGKTIDQFAASLADDLNISAALAALFDFVRDINTLCDESKVSEEEAAQALHFLRQVNSILDVLNFDQKEEAPQELQEALAKRLEARKAKKWAEADALRDFISSKGYIIEDTPAGSVLKKVS